MASPSLSKANRLPRKILDLLYRPSPTLELRSIGNYGTKIGWESDLRYPSRFTLDGLWAMMGGWRRWQIDGCLGPFVGTNCRGEGAQNHQTIGFQTRLTFQKGWIAVDHWHSPRLESICPECLVPLSWSSEDLARWLETIHPPNVREVRSLKYRHELEHFFK